MRGVSTTSDEARGPRGKEIPAATEGTEQVQDEPQSGQSMANCENYQSSEGLFGIVKLCDRRLRVLTCNRTLFAYH